MSAGAICGGIGWQRRRMHHCPTEDRRRRFWVWATSFWYSPVWVCLGCGDSWSDGERGERPFMRGWRQKATAEARRRWHAIPAGLPRGFTPEEYEALGGPL